MEYFHGTKVVTCASKVLDPSEFASQEEFVVKVREVFKETWKLAHDGEEEAVKFDPPLGLPKPNFAPPSELFKTQLLRLAIFILCVLLVRTSTSGGGELKDAVVGGE
jgi:hypothetical protein